MNPILKQVGFFISVHSFCDDQKKTFISFSSQRNFIFSFLAANGLSGDFVCCLYPTFEN